MNIGLLLTIAIGATVAGFIVKYDKAIFRAAAGAGQSAYQHRKMIVSAVLAIVVVGGTLTVGYMAADIKASEWETDFLKACYAGEAEKRGQQSPHMPSNMEINYCHRQWRRQPWYTRAGLLQPE